MEAIYCTNCGRVFNDIEKKERKCSNCRWSFDPDDPRDITAIDSNLLVKRLHEEAFKKVKKIDYYETAINILKAYLSGVACVRKRRFTRFYRVEDMEITCFLFKLWCHRTEITLEFDTRLRYTDVTIYKKPIEGMKCKLKTKDFQRMMRIVSTVYEIKGKIHRPKKPVKGNYLRTVEVE